VPDDDHSGPRSEKPAKATCPRCGGKPAERRLTTRLNPFLPKAKHLTCVDCGLDYGEDGKTVRP
jgi:hypothetical protein